MLVAWEAKVCGWTSSRGQGIIRSHACSLHILLMCKGNAAPLRSGAEMDNQQEKEVTYTSLSGVGAAEGGQRQSRVECWAGWRPS